MVSYKCRGKKEGSEYYQVTDREKKQMVQCRDCEMVMHQSELATVHKELYGVKIKEKACPKCGGKYSLLDYPIDEYFQIYKSKQFFNQKYNKREINLWYDYCDMVDEDELELY